MLCPANLEIRALPGYETADRSTQIAGGLSGVCITTSIPHFSASGPYRNTALLAQDAGWVAGNVAIIAETAGLGGVAKAAGGAG